MLSLRPTQMTITARVLNGATIYACNGRILTAEETQALHRVVKA